MQVHDELILEVPDNELEMIQKTIPSLMTNALALSVPLVAEIGIGKNWWLVLIK
jgi:DNA polymerase-1